MDKKLMERLMKYTMQQLFTYSSKHELTKQFYPMNGQKSMFAKILLESGRAQHFIDTQKGSKSA